MNAFFSAFNGKTIENESRRDDDGHDAVHGHLRRFGTVHGGASVPGHDLKRARRFGDRTAVAFTAVLFGLMHGNLLQLFYAASSA
ncbi:MAG: hypothetical protein ACLU8D_07615 [Enterocloster sp.]